MKKFKNLFVFVFAFLIAILSLAISVNAKIVVTECLSDCSGGGGSNTSLVDDVEGQVNDISDKCTSYTNYYSNVAYYLNLNKFQRSNSKCTVKYLPANAKRRDTVTTYTFSASDNIINIIPLDCFKNRGIHIAIGAEYGFYVNTKTYNSRFNKSSVLVFKVDIGTVIDTLDEQSISISVQPVLCTEYLYCKTTMDFRTDYAYNSAIIYTELQPGFVIPYCEKRPMSVTEFYYKTNDISIGEFASSLELYNLEPGKDKYGTFLYGGEIEYLGTKAKDKEMGFPLHDVAYTAFGLVTDIIGCIPYFAEAEGIISTATDIIGYINDYYTLSAEISDYYSQETLEYITNSGNKIGRDYIAEADKQIAKYGNVIRSMSLSTSIDNLLMVSADRNDGNSTQYIKAKYKYADDLSEDIGTALTAEIGLGFIDSQAEKMYTCKTKVSRILYEPQTITTNKSAMYFPSVSCNVVGKLQNFVKIKVSKPGYYCIETLGVIDTYMSLYDGEFNKLTSDNDDGGEGYNARMNYYLTSNKDYYVAIRGWSSYGNGQTKVVVSSTRSTIKQDTKTTVKLNGELYNVYEFTPSTSGTYTVETTGNYDTYMYLLDVNGNVLNRNDDISSSNRNSLITYYLNSGTKYFIYVRAYSALCSGTSYLTVKKY